MTPCRPASAVLLAVVAALLALLSGCGLVDTVVSDPAAEGPAGDEEPDDGDDPERSDDGSRDGDEGPDEGETEPSPDAEPEPAPPAPEPVSLSGNEVYPNGKTLASEIAQALTTYEAGDRLEDLLGAVSAPDDEALATAAAVLHHDDSWSRGEIVYPQLGGVTDDAVSVMVVVEQTIGAPTGTRTEVRTLDVRLRLEGGQWAFDRLASAGGTPVERPDDLPEVAARVLDHEGIWMPDTARWELMAGEVEPDLLEIMTSLAERTDYRVLVFSEGHPEHVFGTDRLSDHTRGRAVDVYRVGDTDVSDDRGKGSPTHATVEWLLERDEVGQVGSPWNLDGRKKRSFTDVVHQDHLHIAAASDDDEADGSGGSDDEGEPERDDDAAGA